MCMSLSRHMLLIYVYMNWFEKRERQEHEIFMKLLKLVPTLTDRLSEASAEEVQHLGNMLQKGVNSARADDTKGLKNAVIDWIAPPGQALFPPLSRNSKSERGYNHDRTGELLCPAAWDWSDEE